MKFQFPESIAYIYRCNRTLDWCNVTTSGMAWPRVFRFTYFYTGCP